MLSIWCDRPRPIGHKSNEFYSSQFAESSAGFRSGQVSVGSTRLSGACLKQRVTSCQISCETTKLGFSVNWCKLWYRKMDVLFITTNPIKIDDLGLMSWSNQPRPSVRQRHARHGFLRLQPPVGQYELSTPPWNVSHRYGSHGPFSSMSDLYGKKQ